MKKIGPDIILILSLLKQSKDKDQPLSETDRDRILPEKQIHIAITFNGDIEELINIGYEPGSTRKNISYGSCKISVLEKLISHPNLLSIEKQKQSVLQLDGSTPDVKADQVWSRSGDDFSGYTGEGVIIGIIDTGIDFRHENFRNHDEDKTTRILRIWDQTLDPTAQPGESSPDPIPNNSIGPRPLGYGVEYTFDHINDALTMESPPLNVRHQDENGHGTHVAGIAAGDGSQAGNCSGTYKYTGIAPRADIIAVRLFGLTDSDSNLPSPSTSSRTMDALAYIFQQANTLGKPAVINCSFGLFSDEMDGTSTLCQDMNSLLTDNSNGFSIVFAAGNEGNSNFHAKGTVPAGSSSDLSIRFKILPNDTETRFISVVYSGNNIQARLTSPVSGTSGVIEWTDQAQGIRSSTTANGTNGSARISNNPDRILITITPPPSGNNTSGDWTLQLQDTGSTATAINAFCLYGSTHDRKAPYFLDNVTVQNTLSSEATAGEVVTVGSYSNESGDLAASSGRGMTLDLRMKPEITAPGVGIMSCKTNAEADIDGCAACCCDCCSDYYVTKSGTSMAAPHVTGVIALIMQKGGNLTHNSIKSHLFNNARSQPSGSLDDDLGWGVGKLDAKASVDDVTEVNPPSSGTGTTPFTSLVPEHNDFTILRERVLSTERGSEFNRLFFKHFRAIQKLINTNKKVATTWHRNRGPAWFRVGLRSVSSPDIPLPTEVDGVSLQNGIYNLMSILKKYGSKEFNADLEKFEDELNAIKDGMSVNQLMDFIIREPFLMQRI